VQHQPDEGRRDERFEERKECISAEAPNHARLLFYPPLWRKKPPMSIPSALRLGSLSELWPPEPAPAEAEMEAQATARAVSHANLHARLARAERLSALLGLVLVGVALAWALRGAAPVHHHHHHYYPPAWR
jgi:hypothetical protein